MKKKIYCLVISGAPNKNEHDRLIYSRRDGNKLSDEDMIALDQFSFFKKTYSSNYKVNDVGVWILIDFDDNKRSY